MNIPLKREIKPLVLIAEHHNSTSRLFNNNSYTGILILESFPVIIFSGKGGGKVSLHLFRYMQVILLEGEENMKVKDNVKPCKVKENVVMKSHETKQNLMEKTDTIKNGTRANTIACINSFVSYFMNQEKK